MYKSVLSGWYRSVFSPGCDVVVMMAEFYLNSEISEIFHCFLSLFLHFFTRHLSLTTNVVNNTNKKAP